MFIHRVDVVRSLSTEDYQVLIENESELNSKLLFAQELIKTKIQHRYDYTKVFKDYKNFSTATAYAVGDLIYYTEVAWAGTTTYALNARISYNGNIYKSLQAANLNKNPETQPTWWSLVCEDELFFYCILVSTGNYPENATYFTQGDNRNPIIREYVINLAIYELQYRIAPRNIPEWRRIQHDEIISHLGRISDGKDTLLLDTYADDKGHNIEYEFITKKSFDY
jgi:hypothetical protein